MWGPTKVDTELDLIVLEELPYSDNCWKSDQACAYPISRVRIVVHPSLIELAPDVMQFLLKCDLDTETQVLVEEKYGELNSYEETTVWFLKNHEVVWTTWVPPEVAETIKKVVRDRRSGKGLQFPKTSTPQASERLGALENRARLIPESQLKHSRAVFLIPPVSTI